MRKKEQTEESQRPFAYHDFEKALQAFGKAAKKGPFFGTLSGTTGTGKTLLMREFSRTLDPHRQRLIYLGASKVSTLGMARYFAQELHLAPKRSVVETSQVVVSAIQSQSLHLIVWIDEAYRLLPDTMLEIVTMAEFDRESAQSFSVVFSGLPALELMLQESRLFSLRRRIRVRCVLTGLRRNELEGFLVHCFGIESKRIAPAFHDELFERTQGTPALVQAVVQNILASEGEVREHQLQEALDEFGI